MIQKFENKQFKLRKKKQFKECGSEHANLLGTEVTLNPVYHYTYLSDIGKFWKDKN